MNTLLSLNSLARKVDKAVPTVRRRIANGEIKPVASTFGGRPLFDAGRIEEYKLVFNRKPAHLHL
jgi:hypothetical protein